MLYEGKKKEERKALRNRLRDAWHQGNRLGVEIKKPIVSLPPGGDIEEFMKQHSGGNLVRKKAKEALKRRDKAVNRIMKTNKQMMKTEERMLLKYLYMEGYADSYEEAEYLLEELNDEEFEELCERTFLNHQSKRKEEYVLEYLVQEGYADSYENADVILELMSDEWFEQILND